MSDTYTKVKATPTPSPTPQPTPGPSLWDRILSGFRAHGAEFDQVPKTVSPDDAAALKKAFGG